MELKIARRNVFARWLTSIALVALAGCPAKNKPSDTPAALPLAGVTVRLLVVADPALAKAIAGLSGEWKALTGAVLEVSQMTDADLLAAKSLAADAVIYPAYRLGLLVERDLLAAVPGAVLESRELAWPDVFELLRLGEARWGQTTYGIPLGSPQLTCCYRPDLLAKFNRQPPKTWQEYQELAEFFGRRENLADSAPPSDTPWSGTLEPLAPGWAGRMLLARAAPYAKHRDNYSSLFNIETMEPLVAGPPLVRALEELVTAAKIGSPEQANFDPASVRREFLLGHAALAISWPSAAEGQLPAKSPRVPTGFVELPGASQVYNVSRKAWEDRSAGEPPQVPLLAASGRIGSVTQQAAYAQGAFELLTWLAGQKWSPRVCSASPETTLFRRSQVSQPAAWVDAGTDAKAAQQYAQTVQQALQRPVWMDALRIPGQEWYLAALDEAVGAAVSGTQPAAAALQKTADQWRQITAELGLDAQKRAYRRSLGLE